jgi:CBS domain-containing protein
MPSREDVDLTRRIRGGPVVRVREVMSLYPVRFDVGATLRRAAELVSAAGVSDLMVVEGRSRFVGILSEGDLIRALLPSKEDILAAGGSLEDAFQFFVRKGREVAEHEIRPLVITNAVTLGLEDDIAEAAVVMTERQIRRLPVVADGVLVGTVSRADICRAVLYDIDVA